MTYHCTSTQDICPRLLRHFQILPLEKDLEVHTIFQSKLMLKKNEFHKEVREIIESGRLVHDLFKLIEKEEGDEANKINPSK